MWLPRKSMYVFYYAKHPADTMDYDWKECCQLNEFIVSEFGKHLNKDSDPLSEKFVRYSALLQQSVLNAFEASNLAEASRALVQMRDAQSALLGCHFRAQDCRLYKSLKEEHKISAGITAMGFFSMGLKNYFTRKFKPPKAHLRLSHHYEMREVLGYPPRS